MSWAPLVAMGGSALFDLFGGGGGSGSSGGMKKVPTMTKEQTKFLNQMMQMLGPSGSLGQGNQEAVDYQRQLMDPSSEAVRQFTQPHMDQFNQQTIPGLAERFAGMGGGMGGGLSSSGFGQSLSSESGNLQSKLAQLKASLGQQAGQSLMGQYGNMSQQALGAQPFGYKQQGPSMTGGMMQGWAGGGFGGAKESGNWLTKLFGG